MGRDDWLAGVARAVPWLFLIWSLMSFVMALLWLRHGIRIGE